MDDEERDIAEFELFNGPNEWYPYLCATCGFRMWVQDIVVDAFPPDGPGKCPIICCPKCGESFVFDVKRNVIRSRTDPNVENI